MESSENTRLIQTGIAPGIFTSIRTQPVSVRCWFQMIPLFHLLYFPENLVFRLWKNPVI